MKKSLLTLFGILIYIFNLLATDVSGTLTTQTWTSANSPYVLTGNITVPLGVTLTIEAGVEVQFPQNSSSLTVQGTLKAQGTAATYINFNGAGALTCCGTVKGPIIFEATSTNSIMQYVNVNALQYNENNDYTAAIIVNSTSCTISNCNIQNTRGTGLSILCTASPTVTNNTFTANSNMDVILGVDRVRILVGNNPLKVGLTACTMALNDTLTANNLYYRLLANQTVPLTRTLVINPGVEVQFPQNSSSLTVQGALKAQGTADTYINFNGVGALTCCGTVKGPITFEATSTNSIMQYVNVNALQYNENSDYTAAIIVNSTSCTISNCNIQNTRGTGLSILCTASPTVTNNTFTANSNMDVILGVDRVRILVGNNPLKVGLTACTMALNDTLTANNLYYRLLANQTVPLTRTLVINPGVEVQFPQNSSSLTVQGALKAQGTADTYINFNGVGALTCCGTVKGPITFEATSTNSIMQYVNVNALQYNENSDYTAAIIVNSTSCTISNCNIQNTRGTGLSILCTASPTVTNNTFTANSNMDVILGVDRVRILVGNNPLKVGLTACTMALNDTLTANNLYYRLLANQTVPLTRTLVINPGVEVQFPQNSSSLTVQGALKAQGTADTYINFNGVGALTCCGTVKGPITFEATSTNSIMQYVNVNALQYNENTLTTSAIIVRTNSCAISNCIIRNTRGVAMSIAVTSGSPLIGRNCFYDNSAGILSIAGSPKIDSCNFVGNVAFGINNISTVSTDIVDAINCWWGDASGPLQTTTNPTGTGNSISNKVLYSPWSSVQFDCAAYYFTLPLNLVSFEAYMQNNSTNKLIWQTANEVNTKAFYIERSISGQNYQEIGVVAAAGTSYINKYYDFTDANVLPGKSFYRLKMVDIDGQLSYSTVKLVNRKIVAITSIRPNPVVGANFTLEINSLKTLKSQLYIISIDGKVLLMKSLSLITGFNSQRIDVRMLSKGTYFIKIINDEENRILKFIKQ